MVCIHLEVNCTEMRCTLNNMGTDAFWGEVQVQGS